MLKPGIHILEFRNSRLKLVKRKKKYSGTRIGVQVYKVTDQVFPRNKALQPRVKRKTFVQDYQKII